VQAETNPLPRTEDILLPEDVLGYWIGPAADDASVADAKQALWFRKSFETDREIARTFLPTMAALSAGLADDWAARGVKPRLAAIIALDQFSRNVFRGQPEAFENDDKALSLALLGISLGLERDLTEVERAFLYMPLEHAEDADMQARCVALFEALLEEAREPFRPLVESWLDYARRHRDVITRFGRFPHRNAILGRENTAEEAEYLSLPGAGF